MCLAINILILVISLILMFKINLSIISILILFFISMGASKLCMKYSLETLAKAKEPKDRQIAINYVVKTSIISCIICITYILKTIHFIITMFLK